MRYGCTTHIYREMLIRFIAKLWFWAGVVEKANLTFEARRVVAHLLDHGILSGYP